MQKCAPKPNVIGAASRFLVMSNDCASSNTLGSRLAVAAQTNSTVPSGMTVPLTSTSSRASRAVNGVIGSNRSTSSTACWASDGSDASSSHWSGCSANNRSPCASWACVVSVPPEMTDPTSVTHSSSVSSVPPMTEMRSSPGSARRSTSLACT